MEAKLKRIYQLVVGIPLLPFDVGFLLDKIKYYSLHRKACFYPPLAGFSFFILVMGIMSKLAINK